MGTQDRAAERRRATPAAQHTPRDIDAYLQTVEAPKRAALARIRALAHQLVPGAEETISYGMPTLKLQGKPFLGFSARKQHIGIYPYSGQVIETLRDQLQGYGLSTGAIRVPLDPPIPADVLKLIIDCRLEQIRAESNGA